MRKAVLKTIENGGNVSKAMREAGYSEATAHNPQKITDGPAWKGFMQEVIPQEFAIKNHRDLFGEVPTRIESFIIAGIPSDEDLADLKDALASVGCRFRSIQQTKNGTFCFYYAVDISQKAKAVELAYKIHGMFPSDKAPGTVIPIQVNIQNDRSAYSQ
jgi:hypothetical protein